MDAILKEDLSFREFVKDVRVMFILRGLPGSGKSTLSNKIRSSLPLEKVALLSADIYRYDERGCYHWTAKEQDHARSLCLKAALAACQDNTPIIVIDNTNIKMYDVRGYIDMAAENKYIIVMLEPCTPWKWNVEELCQRNTHGVGVESLRKMKEEYECIIPHFYGWFFTQKTSLELLATVRGIYKDICKIALFAEDMFEDEQCCDNMFDYYGKDNASTDRDMLHVTAYFSNSQKTEQTTEYNEKCLRSDVFGRTSYIYISSFCFTTRSLFGQVELTKEQKRFRCSDCDSYCHDDCGLCSLTHVTFGYKCKFSSAQALADNRLIVQKQKLSEYIYLTETEHGLLYQLDQTVWVLKLYHKIVVPAIFTGLFK